MEWMLELLAIPVTDVERAKAFYVEQAGFVLDHDHAVSDDLRFIQLTPPGSACSIALGTGISDAPIGSARAQLVVTDIRAARAELVARGVDVGDVQSLPWGEFLFFEDPDGNRWSVQGASGRRIGCSHARALAIARLRAVECDLRHPARAHAGARQAGCGAWRRPSPSCSTRRSASRRAASRPRRCPRRTARA